MIHKGDGVMKKFECAIVGGGAAGLNAGLYLGLSLREIVIFDNGTNRNRVTKKSHGYLTRDGLTPAEIRGAALQDVQRYDNVTIVQQTVKQITEMSDGRFVICTENGEQFEAAKILFASGIREVFPNNINVSDFYGKSLYSCPYCDGWELKHQSLIVIAENDEQVMHLGKLVYNWSKDIVIATNGHVVENRTKELFKQRGIEIIDARIKRLHGCNGVLEAIEFDSGVIMKRTGGFIAPAYRRTNDFAEQLGCEINSHNQIVTDDLGRTSMVNIYVAGEYKDLKSTSLVIAAAEGSKVAKTINMDMINQTF